MEGFRFSLAVPVRFRDLDAKGHVNNAVYFTYLEAARNAYWRQVAGVQELEFILARAECDYLAAAGEESELRVWVRSAGLGGKSFTLEYALEDARSGQLLARASTVQVSFDYASGHTRPLPDEVRQRLAADQARPGG